VAPEVDKLKLLRNFVLGVVIAVALASIYLTMMAGGNNKSFLLVSLFIIWVLSPLVALIRINLLSRSWPQRKRINLYVFTLVVAAGSLISYAGIYQMHVFKNAFLFLATPFVTWILIAIGYFVFRFQKSV
jgi:hypothetical protein